MCKINNKGTRRDPYGTLETICFESEKNSSTSMDHDTSTLEDHDQLGQTPLNGQEQQAQLQGSYSKHQ